MACVSTDQDSIAYGHIWRSCPARAKVQANRSSADVTLREPLMTLSEIRSGGYHDFVTLLKAIALYTHTRLVNTLGSLESSLTGIPDLTELDLRLLAQGIKKFCF